MKKLLIVLFAIIQIAWIEVVPPPDDWGNFAADSYVMYYWVDADMGKDKDASEALVSLFSFDVPAGQNGQIKTFTVTGQIDNAVLLSTYNYMRFEYGAYGASLTTYSWLSITPQWYGLRLAITDVYGATTNSDIYFRINRLPDTPLILGVE